jgi:hypothetical protein
MALARINNASTPLHVIHAQHQTRNRQQARLAAALSPWRLNSTKALGCSTPYNPLPA